MNRNKIIGNDVPMRWHVKRLGQPVDLDNSNFLLKLIGPQSVVADISYMVNGNVLDILFEGRRQKRIGAYDLVLIENPNEPSMSCLRVPKALILHTDDSGCGCDSGLIDIESDYQMPSNGLSTYQIAKMHGFKGSEEEWLHSLVGKDGLSAFEIWKESEQLPEASVEDFLKSLMGAKGDDGQSAYQLWLANGNVGTVDDFLISLKGAQGDTGLSAYEVWLNNGNEGSEEDFLNSLKGRDGHLSFPEFTINSQMQLVIKAPTTYDKRFKLENGVLYFKCKE